jgi:hypothetical protein
MLFAIALFCAVPVSLDKPASTEPPPAPTFDGWVVKSDSVVPRASIDKIEAKLGGKIAALRNVVYEVNARKVQINVIVPRDAGEADKVYNALVAMKPSWSVVRKIDVLYELVGPNEAMADMQRARDKLAGGSAP